ncbi:hypothetical protein [Paenibacillus silvisoli]|uniref:hypothetical protein n=1 Tax=Paenibacillus silvisoli TaxID=3110539 RepID=UPI002804FD72|nr:hypothetical protein [Paenibacillus silvisoli]
MLKEKFMVKGDLYNRIFDSQSPDPALLVDYEIWNKILAELKKADGYKLPDRQVLSTMTDTTLPPVQ